MTQNQQTVKCDLLTDIGQTKEDSSGRSDLATTDGKLWYTSWNWTAVGTMTQNDGTVLCEVLTNIGQTVKDSSGHNDTKPSDGTVLGTDRHWSDCRREQWTQWHRTKRRYSVRWRQTFGVGRVRERNHGQTLEWFITMRRNRLSNLSDFGCNDFVARHKQGSLSWDIQLE